MFHGRRRRRHVMAAKSAPDKLFDRGFLRRPAQRVEWAGRQAETSTRRRVRASAQPFAVRDRVPTRVPHVPG